MVSTMRLWSSRLEGQHEVLKAQGSRIGNGWGFDFSWGMHDDYRDAAVRISVEIWLRHDGVVHEGRQEIAAEEEAGRTDDLADEHPRHVTHRQHGWCRVTYAEECSKIRHLLWSS